MYLGDNDFDKGSKRLAIYNATLYCSKGIPQF